MDAAQRELNDQIDQATQRLLDDARTIPEADLRAPSLLAGWTRAHVLAHVARGADAMRNLLIGARSGQGRPAYASAQAREADIERGAVMRAGDLMADLADSAMALRAIVRQLPDEAWPVRVRVLDSALFPAAGLLTRRLVEVELHHCDLGTGYSPADWPAAFATMELAEPMRSQRQDRLRYPPPSLGTKPAFPGRPPAPWKPGQRLPGSWLGTGNESRPLPTPPDRRATPFAMTPLRVQHGHHRLRVGDSLPGGHHVERGRAWRPASRARGRCTACRRRQRRVPPSARSDCSRSGGAPAYFAASGSAKRACFTSIYDVAIGDVAPAEAGSASGGLSAVQQLAAAIGSAVVTTVYFSQRAQHGAGHAMTVSIAVVAAIAGMCLGLAWLLPKPAPEEQHLGRIWLGAGGAPA